MNQGDYIAIATISLPVIATLLLITFKRKKPVTSKRVLGMVACGFLAHILITALTICMCTWSPARFITIAVLCAVVCATFLQRKSLRIASFVLFSVAGLTIAHYSHPGDETVSLQPPIRTRERQAAESFEEAKEFLTQLLKSSEVTELPEGWLHQVAPGKDAKAIVGDHVPNDFERSWHSWLTQLGDRKGRRPYGIWYPGGAIKDAIDRLEVRDLSSKDFPKFD